METTYSSTLKIHKLSKAQYDGISTKDATALYLTPEEAVTFTTSGGASAGTTYDGSAPVTVSYATVGAAASSHTHQTLTFSTAGSGTTSSYNGGTARTISYNSVGAAAANHTHTSTITASSESSAGTATSITLSHGTSYKLWTGGASAFTFTMPSASSDTKVTQAYSTTSNSFPLLMCATSGVSATTSRGATTAIVNNQLYANPSTGQLTAKTFYATSDARLKENIRPYSCGATVLDLPIYKYNFVNDESKRDYIGCLAQDLQKVCPELVSSEDSGYLTINESKIVYLLLDEVKKLKAEVEELKAKA